MLWVLPAHGQSDGNFTRFAEPALGLANITSTAVRSQPPPWRSLLTPRTAAGAVSIQTCTRFCNIATHPGRRLNAANAIPSRWQRERHRRGRDSFAAPPDHGLHGNHLLIAHHSL